MNIGDYIRTKEGFIAKIIFINDEWMECDNTIRKSFGDTYDAWKTDEINIIKSSFKIVDLLRIGDYVNRKYLDEDELKFYKKYPEYIKSVVTKEQFETIKYEVRN